MYKGCFLGLTTYDIIYEVDKYPEANEKKVALEQLTSSGGPATNAAITFSLLGGKSFLLSVIGKGPFAQLVRDELFLYKVNSIDLDPNAPNSLPFSSIIIQKDTGNRSVVSINSVKTEAKILPENIFQNNLDIVLVDGHQMDLSREICATAKERTIPCVLDGGSWKAGTENLLPYIDYAICSENFLPPKCSSSKDVISFLRDLGIEKIAITRGEKAIIMAANGREEEIRISQASQIRSTLGAGDVFHGAFCYFILALNGNFSLALQKAAQVATLSCQYLDARQWATDEGLQKTLSQS